MRPSRSLWPLRCCRACRFAQLVGARKVTLRAPHSFLYVEVEDADGSTKQWVIEGATAAQFARQGIDKDAFKIGDPVEVVANPSRSPNSTHARLIKITRTTDGKSWGSKTGESVD